MRTKLLLFAVPCLLLISSCGGTRSAGIAGVPDTPPDAAETMAFAQSAHDELSRNILPFWRTHAPAPGGGFFGSVGDDLIPDDRAPRGALLAARILWTFSESYARDGSPEDLELARLALSDLRTRFHDSANGGYYWAANAQGRILDDRKVLYLQAFAIYALSTYSHATGDAGALEEARTLHRLVEMHYRDKANGGYRELCAADWKPLPLHKARGDPLGAEGEKSQNAHLHLMEAYTALYREAPDASLAADLAAIQDVMTERIYDGQTHHLGLFFDADWKRCSDKVSYGHDIEFSWLLCESAHVLGDPARIAKVRRIAVEVATAVAKEGVDGDGALFNEGDARGDILDDNKDWWPQAEAAVGFLNAWRISGDARFYHLARAAWDFSIDKLSDAGRVGDWRGRVNREGRPLAYYGRIGFWKCPYHTARACMEVGDILGDLTKAKE
jgi:mannobiose 2-epimerase